MAQQSADNLKWHVLIDEAHSNRMAKLMCGEVVEVLIVISDLTLRRPDVQLPAKGSLEVGLCR